MVLSEITASQPHAAYTAYIHGLYSKWSYLSRTIQGIDGHLQALEDIIRNNLLPALTGRPPLNDIERKLFALPAQLGFLHLMQNRSALPPIGLLPLCNRS